MDGAGSEDDEQQQLAMAIELSMRNAQRHLPPQNYVRRDVALAEPDGWFAGDEAEAVAAEAAADEPPPKKVSTADNS